MWYSYSSQIPRNTLFHPSLINTPVLFLRDCQRLNWPEPQSPEEKWKKKNNPTERHRSKLSLPLWCTPTQQSEGSFQNVNPNVHFANVSPSQLKHGEAAAPQCSRNQVHLLKMTHKGLCCEVTASDSSHIGGIWQHTVSPPLQLSFNSSYLPCSFGPQGLCTTSLKLHQVNILPVDSSPSVISSLWTLHLLTTSPIVWSHTTASFNIFLNWQHTFEYYLMITYEFPVGKDWGWILLTIYTPPPCTAPNIGHMLRKDELMNRCVYITRLLSVIL